MSTALGLVGLVGFIAIVITVAMAVTWAVVRLSPAPGTKQKDTAA